MTQTTRSASQQPTTDRPLVFAMPAHPLAEPLIQALDAEPGRLSSRQFPDGESYLQVLSEVAGRSCILIADLSAPNDKYLPLIFLLATLKELGATQVGLVAPYLSYMRQDKRFLPGEALTSGIFAADLSRHMDWLVTVDPHLHRYHSLDEIYTVPSRVVAGAPALADWLGRQQQLLLIGPDAESEQWVADIAARSGHPYVIGAKQRFGDRDVQIELPDLAAYANATAVIIDDVISSGQTLLQCIAAVQQQGLQSIQCAAVHGIFAEGVDADLLAAGVQSLVTTNTLAHPSNAIDITPLLVAPILELCHTST